MIPKLTQTQRDALYANIKLVLETGKDWDGKATHFPAGAMIDAVSEYPGIDKIEDSFETNGWDWDWFQDFEYNGQRYTLCGSGYYGGHSFSRND